MTTTFIRPEITSELRDDGVDKRLIKLFALPAITNSTEIFVEARITEIIRDFFCTTDFSSNIEFKSLIEKFLDSRIPAEPYEVAEYLGELYTDVISHSTRTSSPRF